MLGFFCFVLFFPPKKEHLAFMCVCVCVCPWNHVGQVCYSECLGFSFISCWGGSAGCTLLVSLTVVLKMLKKRKVWL